MIAGIVGGVGGMWFVIFTSLVLLLLLSFFELLSCFIFLLYCTGRLSKFISVLPFPSPLCSLSLSSLLSSLGLILFAIIILVVVLLRRKQVTTRNRRESNAVELQLGDGPNMSYR